MNTLSRRENADGKVGEIESKNNCAQFTKFTSQVQANVSRTVWRTAYRLETARQDYAAAGHLWSQVGCCIGLSFFRMIGGRG